MDLEAYKRLPPGWTELGMARGWMRPSRTPQDHTIRELKSDNERLRAENEQMRSEMAELRAMIEELAKRGSGGKG